MELLEDTADLLNLGLENIIRRIGKNASGVETTDRVEDLRTCFKMQLFLMFFFLHNTRIKSLKNNIKDELTDAGKKGGKSNNSKKSKASSVDKIDG